LIVVACDQLFKRFGRTYATNLDQREAGQPPPPAAIAVPLNADRKVAGLGPFGTRIRQRMKIAIAR
jgi:hypothetical protein